VEKSTISNSEASTLATNAEVERHALLGRYMLEMRHTVNNALTSILGNAELILLDPQSLSSNLKLQVETIHNMGMRINEILQRFSSLQKEMQLVEQQRGKKAAKASAGS
jgi:signal transduction histidine kinase